MRIAKPLLLIGTPIFLGGGLYEGWRLAGGLVFLMAVLILGIGAAILGLVLTARAESRRQPTPPGAR